MLSLLDLFRKRIQCWINNRLEQKQTINRVNDDPPIDTAQASTAEMADTKTKLTSVAEQSVKEDIKKEMLASMSFASSSELFTNTCSEHKKIMPFLQQELGEDFLIADVLELDQATFASMKGVGPAKVALLEQIKEEGRSLTAMH